MPNEHDELARILARSSGDDMDQLARSVPQVAPNMTGRLNAAHEWVTENVLQPARYAGFYPQRVISRYMDPTGRDPFYNPQGTPYTLEQARGLVEALSGVKGYEPGKRESTNVEDRIPRSIWQY